MANEYLDKEGLKRLVSLVKDEIDSTAAELRAEMKQGGGGSVDEEAVKELIREETADLQVKVDESLPTESKEIVGAIKELYEREDKQGLSQEQVEGIVDDKISTEIPAWAKEATKPSYTAQEVGALPSDTPLFSGDYNDLSNKPKIPSMEGVATEEYVDEKISTEIPSWAKEATKPSYTAQEVGALPSSTPLFSGNYNDLSNKPEIPSVDGLASEEYVDEKIGSIETALDEIIAIQNSLIGTPFDELHEYAQSLIDGGEV